MKRIAYYVVDGKVTHHQELPKEWSDDEVALKILEFNSAHPGQPAHLVSVEEGSFEEYLLERVKNERKRTAESIQEALDALDEARDAINSLEKA